MLTVETGKYVRQTSKSHLSCGFTFNTCFEYYLYSIQRCYCKADNVLGPYEISNACVVIQSSSSTEALDLIWQLQRKNMV